MKSGSEGNGEEKRKRECDLKCGAFKKPHWGVILLGDETILRFCAIRCEALFQRSVGREVTHIARPRRPPAFSPFLLRTRA